MQHVLFQEILQIQRTLIRTREKNTTCAVKNVNNHFQKTQTNTSLSKYPDCINGGPDYQPPPADRETTLFCLVALGFAAAARAFGVRIGDFKSRAIETIHIIDLRA